MPPAPPPLDFPAALRRLGATGPAMAALIERHGPPQLRRTRNSFQSLGRAILYQQLTGKAASTIYRRFLGLYPRRRFPTPAALVATPIADLRAVGISGQKAGYLHDLAAKFSDGTIPRRLSSLSDAELSRVLLQVKGVGQWSVDMFLIFGLVRPDVLPVGDLGVRKGMRAFFRLNGLPEPAAMTELAERWRPFRSLGSWYMWRVAESGMPALRRKPTRATRRG